MELQSKTFIRPIHRLPDVMTEQPKDGGTEKQKEEESQVELDMWQLVKSFAKLSKEIVLDTPTSILYDDIPIEKVIEGILRELEKKGEVSFRDMLALKPDRMNLVRNFLATLELARRKSIEVIQENDFEDIKIWIKPAGAEKKLAEQTTTEEQHP